MAVDISKISSTINFADIAFKTSIALNTFSRGKNVPSNLHQLARTITSFALLLKQSAALLQSPKSICSARAADAIQRMAKHSGRVLDEIDDMLEAAEDGSEEDLKSATSRYRYIQACFEERRVQYLLAHLGSLDLSLNLLLQIIRVGRKIDLLNGTENEEQRNLNLIAVEQERVVAQDILFVRQVQTAEVYKTYGVLQQAAEQASSRSPSPVDPTKAAGVKAKWVPLYSLGDVEHTLRNLLDSEETMSSVSQDVIIVLLQVWTTLNTDQSQREQRSGSLEQSEGEDDYYESDHQRHSDEDWRSHAGYHGKRNTGGYSATHHEPAQNATYRSDDEDNGRRHSRHSSRGHSRVSPRLDSQSPSRGSRYNEDRHRRRSPDHRYYSSDEDEDEYYTQDHRHNSRDSRGRSRSPRHQKRTSPKTKPEADDRPANETNSRKSKRKKYDDVAAGKQDTEDTGSDDEAEDDESSKLSPWAATLLPILVDQLRSSNDEKEEARAETSPRPIATPGTIPAQPVAAPLGDPTATSHHTPGASHPSVSKPAPSPKASPHLHAAQPSPVSHDPQRSRPGSSSNQLQPTPAHSSTAAQRYTPKPVQEAWAHQATSAHATQRPVDNRRQPNNFSSPTSNQYPGRRYGDPHSEARPHGERPDRPSSPYHPQAHFDDRLPGSPRYSNHPSPTQQYLSPTSRYAGRTQYDHLSPDASSRRRYSLPTDRLDPHPPVRPSSPSSYRYPERPPSREHRRRESSPRSPPRSRPQSQRRHEYDRPERPRPSSRPTSQQSSRPKPASRKDNRNKPSASRVKAKPYRARAARRMLGPVKLNGSFMKGLAAFGKGLGRR